MTPTGEQDCEACGARASLSTRAAVARVTVNGLELVLCEPCARRALAAIHDVGESWDAVASAVEWIAAMFAAYRDVPKPSQPRDHLFAERDALAAENAQLWAKIELLCAGAAHDALPNAPSVGAELCDGEGLSS